MKRLVLVAIAFALASPARGALYSVGYDPEDYTSDFMIGDVVVSVIFPESDGTLDPNLETWTADRQAQALSEIMTGLGWWTNQSEKGPLSFTFVSQTVPTKYEPITRPYYDEANWIPDIMGKLGYPGTRFTAAKNYVNDLRAEHEADWGFVIFVVDSLNDFNGKLADGYFAYAYLGGPYMVMTYDNNGYGISNMDVVAAHEAGHIFHALDQYAGASSPYEYSYGYFPTINGNHAYSSTADEPQCVMRGGIRWGLSKYSKDMVGWRDADGDGHYDLLDTLPMVDLNAGTPSGSGETAFDGNAKLNVYPRQNNPMGYGITINTIARVEYRVEGDSWENASPADGLFDSADESFEIAVVAGQLGVQTVTQNDVSVRVVTAYDVWTGSHGGGGGSAENLNNAHAFPNPFKPNSNLGHTLVTFTDLTPGAKIQVFTAAGQPVFDRETPAGSTQLPWEAVDSGGARLPSGVYHYLITDDSGHKKKGKIAIIR